MSAPRITAFVGARPNVPKAWTLQQALGGLPGYRVVHTGQHFTAALSRDLAAELGVRIDAYHAMPPAASDARQLGALMHIVERELETARPGCVIAMGDVNSTLATVLVAARMGIPIVHLEAGLRSHDGCPEEINRRVISTLASCHLAPTERAIGNLVREGVARERIHFVGNAMIECLLAKQPQLTPPESAGEYIVVTAHKPLTLSNPEALVALCAAAAETVPRVLFPCHPHTRDVLGARALPANVELLEPLGYLEFAALIAHARVVVTDSDGVQEECCATTTPCCIMADHTARPECLEAGGTVLVGISPERLRTALAELDRPVDRTLPERWDGLVSERIRHAVLRFGASLGEPRRWSARPQRYAGQL